MVNNNRRRGLTIIEVVISTLIVGVLMVPSVTVMTRIARNYFQQSQTDRAHTMARELMSEILQSHFEDPTTGASQFGPESGEFARSEFDDVDDYHNLLEFPIVNRDGSLRLNAEGFTRSVSVQYGKRLNGELTGSGDQATIKLITVGVTGPYNSAAKIHAIRSANGMFETVPLQETSEFQNASIQLQIGAQPQAQGSSIEILNKFPQRGSQ